MMLRSLIRPESKWWICINPARVHDFFLYKFSVQNGETARFRLYYFSLQTENMFPDTTIYLEVFNSVNL
jgi:hypothetical protein